MAQTTQYSDYDSDESATEAVYESVASLYEAKRSKTVTLSIRASYTNWEPREAFRELIQNWRDAIITSSNLKENSFCVSREETQSGRDNVITYKVQHFVTRTGKSECLGFIRFTYDRDGKGKVEITNRNSRLELDHLDIGGTSKINDQRQAGAHGEGLKIALLVLMRGPLHHNVTCRAGGMNWYFKFNKFGRLATRLTPVTVKQAAKQKASSPFAVDFERDVEFVIGGTTRENYNEKGQKVKQERVHLTEFSTWTKAALFLQNYSSGAIISTQSGDLLVYAELRGKIYLKGLLLRESDENRSASATTKPLKFGYNFKNGATNRERQSVSSPKEESKNILTIWSDVLIIQPEMVDELSEMLNSTEPQYADVAGASKHIKPETASRLKQYLCGGESSDKWYYNEEDKAKNPRLDQVIRGLGRESAPLTKTYWGILKYHRLVHTAEEEERRRFTAAPFVEVGDDAFAISVYRLLLACIRTCPNTRGMTIRFVQAGALDLQVFFSDAENLFRIHERWLSVENARKELDMANDLEQADTVFHTVTRLFIEALKQLPESAFRVENSTRTVQWQRESQLSHATQRLIDHQRMKSFAVDTAAREGRLGVRWDVNASSHLGPEVEVQCHRAAQCSNLRDELLVAADFPSDQMACISQGSQCRSSRVSYHAGHHYEADLEPGEEYFFVFANITDPNSFVSLSSVAKAPDRIPPISTLQNTPSAARQDLVTGELRHEHTHPVPTQLETRTVAAEEFLPPMNNTTPSPDRTPLRLDSELELVDMTTPPPAISFALGKRLDELNILEVDRESWYEGISFGAARAVIGIRREGGASRERPRKRPRVG